MAQLESHGADMPWARFDDRFPSNRKVRKLSDAAFRLFVSAVCWCNENLTDGFVSDDDLPLTSDVRFPKRVAAELVSRGLWERLPGGWFIHDFFDYNPRAEQVRAAREAKTERQRRWRDGQRDASRDGAVDASVDESRDASTDATRDASEARAPRARVSRPVPIKDSSSSAGADDAAAAPEPKGKRRAKTRVVPERFDDFWKLYPRRVGKIAAEQAFAKAVEAGADPQAIVDGALVYAFKRKGQDPEFTAHPTTWLNQGRWEDESAPPPPAPSAVETCPVHRLPTPCRGCRADAIADANDDDPWSTPAADPGYEPPF